MTKKTLAIALLTLATIAWAASGCVKNSGGSEAAATGTPTARVATQGVATTASTAAATSAPGNSEERTSPPRRTIGDRGLYVALGDSLSAGFGTSDPSRTFVSLVHASLGARMELLNLGVGGHTSQDLLDSGNVDRAVAEITQRKANSDPNDDVQVITLEIGGNDLIAVFVSLVLPGVCPDAAVSSTKPECVDALRGVFARYRPNLTAALDKLQAADPDLPVLLLTQYNPLQHLPKLGELGTLSIEGLPNTTFPEGLNDVLRSVASGRSDVTVVDVYAAFLGRSAGLVSGDFIHPNDAGYQVMADAVTVAIAALRAR